MKEAELLLAKARTVIRAKAPYLCSTIYGFIPHESPGMGTMGITKGMVLYYDPDWLVTCTPEQVSAALVHESMHHLRNHSNRGDRMEHKILANTAMDLAINPDIREAGWVLPHGVFPKDYGFKEGLTTEEYYDLLVKKEQEKKKDSEDQSKGSGEKKEVSSAPGSDGAVGGGRDQKDPEKGKGGGVAKPPGNQTTESGEKASSEGGNAEGPGEKHTGNPSDNQGPSSSPGHGHGHQGKCGAGGCGGIAGNPLGDFEQALDAEYGRSESEGRSLAKKALQEIKEYAEKHGRGTIPGDLAQALDSLLSEKSKIRWQDELRHVLRKASGRVEAGGMDFSLSHPSKRSPARGFPRPGLVQYLPEVCFVLDTSGSMGTPQIKEAVKEVVGIFKAVGIDSAWFLQADTQVADKKRVRLKDFSKELVIKGRGGTNFDEALKAVEKLKPRPDILVYLTDGDGYVTYRPKNLEAVWCVVPSRWSRKVEVSWGHHIVINEEGTKK